VFVKLSALAKVTNEFRVIPRLLIATYMYVFLVSVQWFMGLEDPTTQQASFLSVIIGAGSAWFGLYVNSGPGQRKE
jgi:hypothetical protein